ncbi:MAG: hypothetical protein AAF961_17115 [Planctomycetota bacterium]
MICDGCAAVFEGGDDSMERQFIENCRQTGFVLRSRRVTMFGACHAFVNGGPETFFHYLNRRIWSAADGTPLYTSPWPATRSRGCGHAVAARQAVARRRGLGRRGAACPP